MSKKKKNLFLLVIFAIILIIVAVACLAIGIKIGRIPLKKEIAEYKEILDYYAPIPEEIYTIEGKITSIEDNLIIMEAASPTERRTADKKPTMIKYKVKIDKDTKITKTEVNINPRKTKISDLTLKDLKVGDKINVRSKENIAKNTEITATLIDLVIFPEI